MADKIPVKAIYSGGTVVGLSEFTTGDTIASTYISGAVSSGFFAIDIDGNLTPVTDVTTDEYFELDINGDIQPKAV